MSGKADRMPAFKNEAEEQAFWESHDSTDDVDWSQAQRVRLPNLKPTTTVPHHHQAGEKCGGLKPR